MELQTISQVSKTYDISTRMLRYYEQVGLIKSIRNEENSYRLYDEATIKRVQQIIILRKLQIPVKQICIIMNNTDAVTIIDIFKKKISELDSEVTALSTVKHILEEFIKELEDIADFSLKHTILGNDSILKLVGSLPLVQRNVKENFTMDDLNKATDILNKLKNVRVVYLPPMTVASAFYTDENAHEKAWQTVNDFVKQSNLFEIKPDLRIFRIEYSNATGKNFGNEVWVSIPDDFIVPSPLTKKIFHGGQYAAHVLGDDGFLTYLGLQDWINESDRYQYDYDRNLMRCEPPIKEIESFGGVRLDPEEILNYYEIYHNPDLEIQYDVLFPVKKYEITDDIPIEVIGSKEKCGFKASIVTKNKFTIMGFTKIITSESKDEDRFINEIKADGRLNLLDKFRKGGAPILEFGSHDMDSQMRGGYRNSFCLLESDITDIQGFLPYNPYIEKIDASRWLIFEYRRGDSFDGHSTCMKLGYTWNGIISGSIQVYADGKIDTSGFDNRKGYEDMMYCWYPVK